MGIAELQRQIGSLECGITTKRSNISQIDASLSVIDLARHHAVVARNGAEGLTHTASYFALIDWDGKHADSFLRTMSSEGEAKAQAVNMREQCVQLIERIEARRSRLEAERGELESSIARDQRAIEQARRSINRLRKAR